MSSPNTAYQDISQLNMTGGIVTTKDLAPSIIFIILYILAGGLYIFRLVRSEDRSLLLIRPGIFWVVRLASLILRAVMSKTTYGANELVAELVLMSIGYLFLISTWIDCWKKYCDAGSPPPHPIWVQRLQRILQLAFLAAVATAIASGAQTSNVFNEQTGEISQPALDSVINTRHASVCLALALICVGVIALCLTHIEFGLDVRGTAYLLVPAASLIIVAAYRVAQSFSTDADAASRSLAAFWVLQILFEFIAFVSYLGISLPSLFPRHPDHKTETSVSSGQVEMAYTDRQGRFGRLGSMMSSRS